jgi:hypothetical protein
VLAFKHLRPLLTSCKFASNTKKMKLTISFILFISFRLLSQGNLNDTIWWEGDKLRYTLINEIHNADIILKKGGKIKNVGLSKLSANNTVLEYIENNTLHDIQTEKIERIVPGSSYQYALVFKTLNKPFIIKTDKTEIAKTYAVFPSNSIKSSEDSDAPQISILNLKASSDNHTNQICDTLIFEGYKKLLIHVYEINSKEIKYRRADIPNGPLYIIKTDGLYIRELNNIKIIQQNLN